MTKSLWTMLGLGLVAVAISGCAIRDNGTAIASTSSDLSGYGSSYGSGTLYDVQDPYHIDRDSARQSF